MHTCMHTHTYMHYLCAEPFLDDKLERDWPSPVRLMALCSSVWPCSSRILVSPPLLNMMNIRSSRSFFTSPALRRTALSTPEQTNPEFSLNTQLIYFIYLECLSSNRIWHHTISIFFKVWWRFVTPKPRVCVSARIFQFLFHLGFNLLSTNFGKPQLWRRRQPHQMFRKTRLYLWPGGQDVPARHSLIPSDTNWRRTRQPVRVPCCPDSRIQHRQWSEFCNERSTHTQAFCSVKQGINAPLVHIFFLSFRKWLAWHAWICFLSALLNSVGFCKWFSASKPQHCRYWTLLTEGERGAFCCYL